MSQDSQNNSTRKNSESGSSNSVNFQDVTGDEKFILPGINGGSPKIVSFQEVIQLAKDVENMTLVHEIALDPDFKLQLYEPTNPLEKLIKETIHKAFWDVLREQLNSTPPVYDHALQLLKEIKECFPKIIADRNKKAIGMIDDKLDIELIYQQAKNNTLDFKDYADFVIDILGRSCAPIRDEQIAKLKQIDDVIEVFKGIFEVITLMKIDMANCLLEFTKNELLTHSVEYEKKKFQETLKFNTEFPATKAWLNRNEAKDESGETNLNQTVFRAYMELLDWNSSHEYPEVLLIDKTKLEKISINAKKLCYIATICGTLAAIPACRSDKFQTFSRELLILLEPATCDGDIENLKENVWVHIKSSFSEVFNNTTESTAALQKKILEVCNKDSPVYKLMWKRIATYVCLILKNRNIPPAPPGFETVSDELEIFGVNFKRVIMHNYSVYGNFYEKIIKNQDLTPSI